jgi:dihydrofolate reductase
MMRLLKYYVATTADGFIAHTDGSVSGFLTEGEHIADYLESLQSFDTALMGRATYDFGLKYGVTNPYPWMKSYVFSTTMTGSPDANVEIVSSHAADFVLELKEQAGGDIYLCGGQQLATALLPLIDEVIVKINPVLIGSGKTLFSAMPQPLSLELTKTKVYDNGVVFLHYDVQL